MTRVFLTSSVSTNCTGISMYRDQHSPHPEVANTYPDVHRLAVGVREHPLDNTDLLPHRIVDRVTRAVAGCRRSCPAHTLDCAACIAALGISYSFRADQVEGRLVVPK